MGVTSQLGSFSQEVYFQRKRLYVNLPCLRLWIKTVIADSSIDASTLNFAEVKNPFPSFHSWRLASSPNFDSKSIDFRRRTGLLPYFGYWPYLTMDFAVMGTPYLSPLNPPKTAFWFFNESVPHKEGQNLSDHVALECSLDHFIRHPALEKRRHSRNFFKSHAHSPSHAFLSCT